MFQIPDIYTIYILDYAAGATSIISVGVGFSFVGFPLVQVSEGWLSKGKWQHSFPLSAQNCVVTNIDIFFRGHLSDDMGAR